MTSSVTDHNDRRKDSGGDAGLLSVFEPAHAVVHARDLSVQRSHLLQQRRYRTVKSHHDGSQHGHIVPLSSVVVDETFDLLREKGEVGLGHWSGSNSSAPFSMIAVVSAHRIITLQGCPKDGKGPLVQARRGDVALARADEVIE